MTNVRLEDLGNATTLGSLRESRWSGELRAFEGFDPCIIRSIDTDVDVPGCIKTGDGPYVIQINGSLKTKDHLHLWTEDYFPGLIIVRGDLHARTLSFGNGARIFVEGSVLVEDCLFGQYGDHNAVLSATGELQARAVFLAHGARVYADRGVRALVYAPRGSWESLTPDIENEGIGDGVASFDPSVLDRYGDLHFRQAEESARAGKPLFLPGVEERFPQRLSSRKTD
ncbi:hypothetical protein D7X55_22125 [Corallococcus sp. AB049A]|uniref:Polymer-forming cytoskeletal protein n=1 Tax=Corallococcus interemptor TaxID=2316720 RepID=A0A3A8QW83_9BACT|nr:MULTISPECIES: hypothetical protein [Corallococcus]RKH51014.1 hypothetical protein D7Y23_11365 [Corallococcus sp. AB050B]RKH69092.1 hypothetical protein D7X96_16055 [Corallococcus interemptor]RKI62246.1 hypothetical protein D7X55_22125 [Corallococcus sp. AB049A]